MSQGFPAKYVKFLNAEGRKITFEVDGTLGMFFSNVDTLDLSLSQLVERILPLSRYYINITRFVEENSKYSNGLVYNALCEAINTVLKVK
jgi:gamma-tubulin complex component 2